MWGVSARGAEPAIDLMSAIAENPARTGSNGVNVRAFLAGGGATTALIAAAVVAFLSVAALVAFNDLPIGGGDADAGSVQVGEVPTATGPGAPELAADALGGTAGAVAGTPAAATAVDPSLIPGFAGPGGSTGAPGLTAPGGSLPGSSGTPTAPGTTGSGALGGAVGGLEDTAGEVGLDLPLSDVTGDLTGPLDQTANDTLSNVGGGVGNPNLGNDANGAVNNVTNGLLGPKGATDQLLNP
jgi:hypothetical protein